MMPLLTTYFATFLPDVVLFVGNVASDKLKRIYYHELAHAVHCQKVGNSYWIAEVVYTISHTGYGDGTDPGADRVEVVETWGNEMGYYLADRFYGLNHSLNNSGNVNDQERLRHLYYLENRKFYNDTLEFIPRGLFRDLVDDNSLNPLGVSENPNVTDNVKDFTHLQIYEALTNDVDDVEALKAELQNNTPTLAGNTIVAYDALFSSYGY